MKNIRILAIGVIIGLLIWAGFNLLNDQEDADNAMMSDGPVKIGWMGPLTGDAASYGESVQRGVQLAMEELGLENVELIFEDSKCDPKEAVTVANKLINVDGVVAIIGELCSGATLAVAPIAEESGVVLISAASTSPAISAAGDYIFRTVPSDALQGDFGSYLAAKKGNATLAVLYSNEDYGLGFNNVLKEVFEKNAGQVVASEAFERGTSDLRTQLTKIKSANPAAIYIISNSPDSAVAALRQIRELGISAMLFASEGLKDEGILTGAGEAAEGLIITSVTSGSSSFIEKHEQAYGEGPGPFAAQGYDAFMALAQAIESGAYTGSAIKDALYEVDFEGATGRVRFDEMGDVAGIYAVFMVVNGSFELQTEY